MLSDYITLEPIKLEKRSLEEEGIRWYKERQLIRK